MTKTRFENLQDTISTYGAAAFENLLRCKGLGRAIIDGFPGYISCSKDCVTAVPPAGQFDPRKDYGQEAFSYAHRPVIVLEPIRFGLALTVKNQEDTGSLWLRTAIAIEVTGNTYDVFVAQRPIIRIPVDTADQLEPVYEAIYQEFLSTFKLEVLEFRDERFETGIGFLPL